MLITNSSALIVPQPASATNAAAGPVFHEAPKPLIYIPNQWLWVVWTAVILALLTALWFGWRWWRRKPAFVPPPVPAHVRARRRLEQALASISEPKLFSILVSGAIREYLEERFDFRAPERTTEEFLHELQGSFLLTVEQKASLADFLASCDLIKFAKYEPTETELRGLYQSALRLVHETEPRPGPANVPPPIRNIPPTAPQSENPQSATVLADAMTAGPVNSMAEAGAVNPVSIENRSPGKVLNAGPQDEPRNEEGEWTQLADEHWTGTHREMRERADAIMRAHTTAHHPELGEIKLTGRKARTKTLGHMKTPHEFQSVQAIPEINSKGTKLPSQPDLKKRSNVVAVHKLERKLKIGEAQYKATSIIRETHDGKKTTQHFYLHRIDPIANRKTGSPYCVPAPCGEKQRSCRSEEI
jgi:hypothetical protein